MQRTGRRSHSRWSQEEHDWLVQKFPNISCKEAAKHLGRSHDAVRSYIASHPDAFPRNVGTYRHWMAPEVNFVRDNYPAMGGYWCADMLSRPYAAVNLLATRMGLRMWKLDDKSIEGVRSSCCIEDCDDGCWLWLGRCSRSGVPIAIGNNNQSLRRRVWLLAHPGQTLPSNFTVQPICGQSKCLNPEHLRKQSWSSFVKENNHHVNRFVRAIRTRNTRAAKGSFKLNWEKVAAIRASDKGVLELAREYGVHADTIKKVLRWETWASPPTKLMPLASATLGNFLLRQLRTA